MNHELMTDHQKRIAEFMRLAGQDLPDSVTVPSFEVRRLRAKLIMEEALETIDALGIRIIVTPSDFEYHLTETQIKRYEAGGAPDITLIADGCADTSVVTIGTLLACGIADKPLLEEVDRSNLAKFELPKCPKNPDIAMRHIANGVYECGSEMCNYTAQGPYRRDDGKWMRGPDWKEPDIDGAISQSNQSQQYLHHQPPAIGSENDTVHNVPLSLERSDKTAHCHHCRGILSNKLMSNMKEQRLKAFQCPDCMGVLNLQEIIYA